MSINSTIIALIYTDMQCPSIRLPVPGQSPPPSSPMQLSDAFIASVDGSSADMALEPAAAK